MSSPGLITELNYTVDALQAKIERLRASNAELLAALEEVERWFIYERPSDREWPPFAKVLSAIARAKKPP